MAAVTQAATRLPRRAILRADERALLGTAGVVFALASAGAAMSAAAADAMFLSALGPSRLGEAVALSSALLAAVLAVVGGLSDRLERRRVLATLSIVSGVVIAGLAALALIAPTPAAVLILICGKQLAAGTDLAFWVVIAERVDARRSKRLLPMLAAMGGAGAALGAVLVIPIAAAAGATGVLVCAAVVLVLAGVLSSRLTSTRRVGAAPAAVGALITRAWRDGARAVRRHPLAMHLAIVVAAAGVFGSLAYFALAVEVSARGGTTAELAAVLGGVRGGGQLLTLVVQLAITPWLLTRMGTGRALLAAPLFALAAGLGLVIAPLLAVAIAAQVSARVLDAGVETPAEKLAQTLLPTAVRGRVAGFLDGTAKRVGAVAGGLIAAVLAGAPETFYVTMAIAGAVWLLAAVRIAHALPTLAVAHVAHAQDADAVVDDRAIALLIAELAAPTRDRAAEVLARLHERGRVDAVQPLITAAIDRGSGALWRAVVQVLDAPAEHHGAAIAASLETVERGQLELTLRALGLAGGAPPSVVARYQADLDTAIALAAEVCARRLRGDDRDRSEDGVVAVLAEAIRDTGPPSRVAIDELCVEIARALAAGDHARALEPARHLARALRRRRGTATSRAAGFTALTRVVERASERREAELSLLRADLLELARDRVEASATPVAPDHMLTSLMRLPGTRDDDAPEIAAALRLYGELLEGADVAHPDDLRRIARALGEPDDDVRAAAEQALTALGPAAAGELVATVAWGRRRARDRAAALLAELPVTPGALDRLIDAELDSLDQTHASIAVLDQPTDALLARRLDERLREIAHTVLLLVAARQRSQAIARASVAWRHARGGLERARTLAVIETALPRALVGRLVEAVDDLTPADRAAQLDAAGVERPTREAVIHDELAGRDRLARGLVLHLLGAAGRSAHRETITGVARAEVLAAAPAELVRRVTEALHEPTTTTVHEEGEADMPSRVETLMALSRVPLLASLSTRQLADVAERARWSNPREGAVVVTTGDLLDAMIVVDDGELQLGDRVIGKGEVVDELACFAPMTVTTDLRVRRSARLIRLDRIDIEELVDDVPGLAAAVCRGLGERARKAVDEGYRSPLTTRS